MQVTIKVPDDLVAEARARGLTVEKYIEEMLARQSVVTTTTGMALTAGEAVNSIRALRKGKTLAGLSTKDLIHEGRKY